jgi:hypothetical protein
LRVLKTSRGVTPTKNAKRGTIRMG